MEAKEYIRMVDGSDTAVLMVHGIVGTPAHFRDLLPLIPEEWSVCNLLLDGHGKGVREFGATSMDKWKMQVFARLDDLLARHRRVLIVAHSMGTLFALRAAVNHPDRIAGLFLLNVPMRVHVRPSVLPASLKNAFGLVKEGDGPAWAMKQDCGVELSPYLWQYIPWIPRYVELLREISAVRALLPQVKVPALAFHSPKDELVSNRALRDLQGHSHITVTLLPSSGHFSYEKADLQLLQTELAKQIAKMRQQDG